MPGFLTNGLPTVQQIGPLMRIPVDTEFPQGENPASVAGTALQIAGVFAEVMANASTAVSGAVTSNQLSGLTTTEALVTAVGATYTLTLTNNQVTAAYVNSGAIPSVAMYSGSNTGGTAPPTMSPLMTLISVTTTVGSVVFVWRNDGTSALNGTMRVVWHL